MTGLIVDNFAGGGGASTGIEAALSRAVDIAINHDEEAIRMHEANHPGTRHIRNNIWQVDPRDVTGGEPVDLAWFSPDCKHFSKAKGGKPREKSIRDLAWVVVLWAQRAKPRLILLENVEEFRTWGPLCSEGLPIKERQGETFDKWCRELRKCGYRLQFRELRACDYGAPTIRKRFFMIARCDGQPIVWPTPTHGKPGSEGVLSGALKPWRTAAEIIDWSIPCPSIFERKKPLAEKTLRRIAHGIMKFVVNNPRPFIVPLTHHGSDGRSYDSEEPLSTVTAAHRGELAIIAPHITKFREGATGHHADEPLHTVTANSYIKRPGGSAPLGLVSATVAPIIGGTAFKNTRAARVFETGEPVRTQTGQAEYFLATAKLAPFVSYAQQGGANRLADEPLHTITASLKDHNVVVQAFLSPVIVGCGGRRGQSGPAGPEQPYPTTTAKADACLATAHLVHIGNGERIGQAPRALKIEKPPGTVVASGTKHHLVTALMQKFAENGVGVGLTSPLHTVMAGAPRHAVITAHIEQANGSPEGEKPLPGRRAVDPLSTIVAKGCTQRLVTSNLIRLRGTADAQVQGSAASVEEPLNTISSGGIHSAEVRAFLIKYYGNEQDGHGLDNPIGTVTVQDRFGLVTVTIDGEEYVIVDIGMRMLSPRELFAAQGFPPDYVIDRDAEGRPITKTAQVAKCGNSVCPPLAEALVRANASWMTALQEAEAA